MTRERMVINIRKRLKDDYDIDVSKEVVNAILDIEQDEVYMVIAQEDSYRYIWGTIYGEEKKPKRISGMYTEFESVKKHGGYSLWKRGYPKVKWARVTKVCENHEPREFFEQPEYRYTSEAREFRQRNGIPEIPEYENLEEEEILKLCKRADDIQFNSLSKSQQYNKKRDEKFNKQKMKAIYAYWEQTGYIPMGADTFSKDGYKGGVQRDTIDHYLKTRLFDKENELTVPEKLDVIRSAIDIAEYKQTLDIHPELIEYRDKYIEEIKNSGLEEIVHIKKNFQQKYALKYDGEDDPWGFYNESNCKSEREERKIKEQEEFSNDLEKINSERKG